MKSPWLACWIWIGAGASLVRADIFDDSGVGVVDLYRFQNRDLFPAHYPDLPASVGELLQGIPLSAEHEAEARKGFEDFRRRRGPGGQDLEEARGDFAKALEILDRGEPDPLHRARLLLRMGREAEARAEIDGVTKVEGREGLAFGWLLQATRPLENAEEWDLLDKYLDLLLDRLTDPSWRVAIWREQADVAHHRGQLPALLASAEGDVLRLAVIRGRMADEEESEKLLSGILEGADVPTAAALLVALPRSRAAQEAAIARWGRPDLSPGERRALWQALEPLVTHHIFTPVFLKWLRDGGDISPFADLFCDRWLDNNLDSTRKLLVTELIQARHPRDPRFQYLLGVQLLESDAARATRLFEAAALSPLLKGGDQRPELIGTFSYRERVNVVDAGSDVALLGFHGLGRQNRQDRIAEVIASHPSWGTLPLVDRARYLAIGGMDHALAKLVLDADPADPANASLVEWLATALEARSGKRIVPAEVYHALAEKMTALAVGAPGKEGRMISRNAAHVFRLLVGSPLEPPVVEAALKELRESVAQRPEVDAERLEESLAIQAARFPRFAAFFPPKEQPQVTVRPNAQETRMLVQMLDLFSMPEINRLAYLSSHSPRYVGKLGEGTLVRHLTRWQENFGKGPNPRPVFPNKSFTALLDLFPAGHPRRLLVDALIHAGAIPGVEEKQKAASLAAIEDLLQGKVKVPGTELYRFLALAEQGADETVLRQILEEVATQPGAVRGAFLRSARTGHRFENAKALSIKVLEKASDGEPGQEPDADLAKLRELMRVREQASPEGIVIALRIMDEVLAEEISLEKISDADKGRRYGNLFQARAALQQAGKWESCKEAAADKIRQSGLPELEGLRILWRLEDGIVRSPEQSALARRILELDPSDHQSANLLVGQAFSKGDLATVEACVRSLGASAFSRSDVAGFLSNLPAGSEARMLVMIEAIPPLASRMDLTAAEAFHTYFLKVRPGDAARFREWISRNREVATSVRVPFAKQLCAAGREDEAVEIFVSAFTSLHVFTGAPFAFPLRADVNAGSRFREMDRTLPEQVEFLTGQKLLAAVVAALEARDPQPSLEAVVLWLAVAPDVATFEQKALPLLGNLSIYEKRSWLRDWFKLFQTRPDTAPLLLRLAKEEMNSAGFSPDDVPGIMVRIGGLTGGSTLVPVLWARLKGFLEDGRPRAADHARLAADLLPFMIEGADDETWADYWKWRSSASAPIRTLVKSGDAGVVNPFLPGSRLRQVLPLVFDRLDVASITPEKLEAWAAAAIQSGDPELVRSFRSKLPADVAGRSPYFSLAEGRLDAMFPVIGAFEADGGETTLWWSLPALQADESGLHSLPIADFPVFDGKLDLQILGAREPGRFEVIRKVEQAPASGSITLPLAEELRSFLLIATEREGSAVRFSRQIGRSPGKQDRADLSGPALIAKGFKQIEVAGPGGLPTYLITPPGPRRIELAELPWEGSGEVRATAWTAGAGRLALDFLDSEGKVVVSRPLSSTAGAISTWRQGQHPWQEGDVNVPPSTERVVLAVTREDSETGGLAVSGLSFSVSHGLELPPGFEKLGRIPGRPTVLALSPDGTRLAVGTHDGRLRIMELATGKVTTVKALAAGDGRVGIESIAWAGGRLFAGTTRGDLYRLDPGSEELRLAWDCPPGVTGLLLRPTSKDGKWVAWATHAALFLLPPEGDAPREIAIAKGCRIAMTEEGVRIESPAGRMLLVPGDFATGQPVESSMPFAEWREGWYESRKRHPKWEERVNYGKSPARVMEEDRDKVILPARGSTIAFTKDGTLYYVDDDGNVVKVK